MFNFQQELKKLRQRPEIKSVYIETPHADYQLQVYQDHSIQKILNRFMDNQQISTNSSIIVMINEKRETNLNKKIKQFFDLYPNQKIIIKFKEQKQQKSLSTSSKSIILQEREGDDNQVIKFWNNKSKKQNEKINVKELQVILANLHDPKYQQNEIYKPFKEAIINKIKKQYISLKKVNQIMDQLAQNINLEAVKKKIEKDSEFEETIRNLIKDINRKNKSLKTNEAFLEKVWNKLKEQRSTKEQEKKEGLDENYGSRQGEILTEIHKLLNIKKSMVQLQQTRSKLLKQRDELLMQLNTSKCTNLSTTMSTNMSANIVKTTKSRKQSHDFSFSKKQFFKVTTCFLNQNFFEMQMGLIVDTIQKYEENYVNEFVSVFSIREGKVQMDIVAKLLDFEKSLDEDKESRIMMIISTSNDHKLVAYSKGVIRQSKNKSGIKKIQSGKSMSEEQGKNFHCDTQHGFGFVMLPQDKKIFLSTTNESIIRYDDMFLDITKWFRIMYGQKSLQISLQKNKKGELKDQNNQLPDIFNKKIKQEISEIEVFCLKFQDNTKCQKVKSRIYKPQIWEKSVIDQSTRSIFISEQHQKD